MAAADTAKLITELALRDRLSKGLKTASGNVGKFESRWDKMSGKLKAGLAVGGVALAGVIGTQVKAGLDSLVTLENAVSSVDGAIKQVGPTWKTTGKDIADVANRIEADVEAAFDDKDIVAASATLIRYGKVSEKNLTPALEVMTDLAARTGSVESAASLLAKALADPSKAAGKLARQGVVLTKAQQKQLKAMVEVNDTAGAQAYLLGILEETTRGAAAASKGPAADAQNTLNDALEDGQRLLAEGFLPVITRVRDLLRKGLADESTKTFLRDFGKGIAGGLDDLITIATSLPWAAIGDSLRLAGTGARAVLGAFTSLPPWVQTAVLTAWGLNKVTGGFLTDIASGLIKGVLGINAGVVNLKAATVVGGGGLPGAAGAAGAAGAIGTGLALSAITAAVAATVIASIPHAERNQGFADKGLNKEEREAINYYSASKADQATMAKRLGYIPDKDTFNAAQSKLDGSMVRVGDRVSDAQRGITAAQNMTRMETTRGANQIAATQLTSAGLVVAGFRANRPNVYVNVDVSATTVNRKTTVNNRYGPNSGWREGDGGSGKKTSGGRPG